MTDAKIKQTIQEAIEALSNRQGHLQTIGTAAAIAGTISLGLFFVINAQIDSKTSDIKVSQAVFKSQLKTTEQGIQKANAGIADLGKKFDNMMLEILKSKKE